MSCACHSLTRRRFLGLTAAACALPLSGCDDVSLPFNLVSEETVTQLGLQNWEQIRKSVPLSSNASYNQALQGIGAQLLRAAGKNPREWELRVFAGEQVNAFALPGKKIGIYEGMMRMAENPAQLAAVLGHEIGHHLAEHSQERLNAAALQDLGMTLVNFALDLGNVDYAREIAALLGLGVEVGLALPYSRNQELEADRLGVELMREAGYDPRGAVELWERMQAAGGNRLAFLSTHPAPGDRAEALRRIVQQPG